MTDSPPGRKAQPLGLRARKGSLGAEASTRQTFLWYRMFESLSIAYKERIRNNKRFYTGLRVEGGSLGGVASLGEDYAVQG